MTGPLARHPRRRLGRHGLAAAALAALVGLAAPGARAQEISDEARQHFRAGVNYLQDPDGERVEEAYVEFKRAYEISKSPKVLGNIGYCAMRLERDGEALDAYTRYLSSAPDIKAEEREQIERDLQTLTASAVRLTITADVKEATIVDARYPVRGAPVTNRYALRDGKAEIIVRAGHHVVRLQTEGADRGQWQFDALGGTSQSKNFQVTKAAGAEPGADPGRGGPVVPWVLVGVGGAALLGGGVTGFLTLQKVKDLEDRCPDDRCPLDSDYESRKSSTKTLALTTDALLIGGGLMAAAGAGWLIFGSKGGTKAASSGTLTGGAACAPGGCAAVVGGRFLDFVPRGLTMQRTLRPARALVAAALLAAGCTAISDVDRFQGALEDKNPYASLTFTVVDMKSHVQKYFELRMIDDKDRTQFIAIADPFDDTPQATFNIPHMAFKNKLATYRLDFFGDMNGDRKYNYGDRADEAGNVVLGDHSWRVKDLGEDNRQVVRRNGSVSFLELRYVHNPMYDELTPALEPTQQGRPATIELTGLEEYQNRLLQVRVSTSDTDQPHTIGLFRAARVKAPAITALLPDVVYEPQPYQIDVYVDANNNGRYDNPEDGDGDLGWRFEVDAPTAELRASFNLREARPSDVDVGPP